MQFPPIKHQAWNRTFSIFKCWHAFGIPTNKLKPTASAPTTATTLVCKPPPPGLSQFQWRRGERIPPTKHCPSPGRGTHVQTKWWKCCPPLKDQQSDINHWWTQPYWHSCVRNNSAKSFAGRDCSISNWAYFWLHRPLIKFQRFAYLQLSITLQPPTLYSILDKILISIAFQPKGYYQHTLFNAFHLPVPHHSPPLTPRLCWRYETPIVGQTHSPNQVDSQSGRHWSQGRNHEEDLIPWACQNRRWL